MAEPLLTEAPELESAPEPVPLEPPKESPKEPPQEPHSAAAVEVSDVLSGSFDQAVSTQAPPPVPVPVFQLTRTPRYLFRASPVYPEAMRVQGRSGVVKLEVLIDKAGQVREVRILKSAGKLFDDAARRAILSSTFLPAEVDGQAVAVLWRLPVKFSLN